MKNDREIFRASVKQNVRALIYASIKLKIDRQIIQEVIGNVNSSRNESIEDLENLNKIQGYML